MLGKHLRDQMYYGESQIVVCSAASKSGFPAELNFIKVCVRTCAIVCRCVAVPWGRRYSCIHHACRQTLVLSVSDGFDSSNCASFFIPAVNARQTTPIMRLLMVCVTSDLMFLLGSSPDYRPAS